jgi:hypothetical protein
VWDAGVCRRSGAKQCQDETREEEDVGYGGRGRSKEGGRGGMDGWMDGKDEEESRSRSE